MSLRTASEALFESFCACHGITCARIPRDATRTADYRLTFDGITVIAEVKQLDPGPEDDRIARQMAERGSASGIYVPGARIRQEITDAKGQLRRLAKGRHPAVLVVYNNTGVGSGRFTDHDVLTALYGEELIEYTVPADSRVESVVLAHRFGGRRSVTPDANTTLSAVGVLRNDSGTLPALDVYHNCFAAIPLNPSCLRMDGIRHFGIDRGDGRQFQDWHAV